MLAIPVRVAHELQGPALLVAGDHVRAGEGLDLGVRLVRVGVLGVELRHVGLRHRDRDRHHERVGHGGAERLVELEDDRLVIGRRDAGDRLALGVLGAHDRGEVGGEVAVGHARVQRALEGVLDVRGLDLLAVDRRLLHRGVLDARLDLDRHRLAVGRDLGRPLGEIGDRLLGVAGGVVVERPVGGEDRHVVQLEVRLARVEMLEALLRQQLQRAALRLVVGGQGGVEAAGHRLGASAAGRRVAVVVVAAAAPQAPSPSASAPVAPSAAARVQRPEPRVR